MVAANSHLPLRNLTLSCFCLQSYQAVPLRRQGFTLQFGFNAHQTPKGVKASVSEVKWQLGNSSKRLSTILRCNGTSSSSNMKNDSTGQDKTPFGYSRKDVLLIGVGVTAVGWGLKSGLEYFGVDPLQAGNVVQLVIVLGLTVGWISTYLFRVSNKEMTYAQQLRDYEKKVMEKRLESLTEAELEALLEQVEEEKRRLGNGDQIN